MEITSGYGISKIIASKDMAGRSLREVGFGPQGDKYGISVVAIRRGRNPIISPSQDEVLQENDHVIVAAMEDPLRNLDSGN
jgi:trk system potassium uptake protein TrkA